MEKEAINEKKKALEKLLPLKDNQKLIVDSDLRVWIEGELNGENSKSFLGYLDELHIKPRKEPKISTIKEERNIKIKAGKQL